MYRRNLMLTLLALPLAACVGDQPVRYTPETPAERELRLSRERLERTVGEGALAGAGAGAALGALAGGVEGGFRGAQIGRLGGAAAGTYVRQLQERYAQREALLGQVARDMATTNARMEASIAALRNAAAQRRSQPDDAVRARRISDEAAATVQAGQDKVEFFTRTRSLLDASGLQASGSLVDPALARLRQRVSTMREIAATLSG